MHSNESVHLQDTPRAISNGLPVFSFAVYQAAMEALYATIS